MSIPDVIIEQQTFEVKSLLSVGGLRFAFSSFVNNFAGFTVVAVMFIAMAGCFNYTNLPRVAAVEMAHIL